MHKHKNYRHAYTCAYACVGTVFARHKRCNAAIYACAYAYVLVKTKLKSNVDRRRLKTCNNFNLFRSINNLIWSSYVKHSQLAESSTPN